MINIQWTDEMVKVLTECAEKNMSSSQIGNKLFEKFKIKFTRNAIIGKAHRLKIKVGKPPKVKPVVVKKENAKIILKKEENKTIIDIEKPATTKIDGFLNPRAIGVSLLDLVEGQCKYPVGDIRTNDLFFCGAPADSLKSRTYCSYCYPILYQPLAKYRENKAK